MFVVDYFYEVSTLDVGDRVQPLEDRVKNLNLQYVSKYKSKFENMNLAGKIGVLYVGGISTHNGEDRIYSGDYTCSLKPLSTGVALKSLQSYMMHRYIGLMPFKDSVLYASINSNTCASSMYSLYEAERLLKEDLDYVVVIAEEKTSFSTMRVFAECGIAVKPGEGFACVVLGKDGKVEITDTKWAYSYDKNPFYVSSKGYSLVATESAVVKGHKTGTQQNEEAERIAFGEYVVGYKDKVGHGQGASGLLELCMVLDDDALKGSVLCAASGLGGFYGSCVVRK